MSDENADIWRMIEIDDLVEERKLAPTIDRDAWIKASRLIFAPGERQPCHVCAKFKSIAEAHHVVPLTAQYDRGFKYPDQEFVWLCPNHHAMTHLFIPRDNRSMTAAAFRGRDRVSSGLYEDLSDDELNRVLGLMRRSFRGPE